MLTAQDASGYHGVCVCYVYYCFSTMYGVIYLYACLGGKLVWVFVFFRYEYKLVLIPIHLFVRVGSSMYIKLVYFSCRQDYLTNASASHSAFFLFPPPPPFFFELKPAALPDWTD